MRCKNGLRADFHGAGWGVRIQSIFELGQQRYGGQLVALATSG